MDGIPPLKHVDHNTQLGVILTLADAALNPAVDVTDKLPSLSNNI